MDEFMKNELENTRDYAIQAISYALQIKEYNEGAASCIAYAFLDGHTSAENIFCDCHLSLLDCYAIMRDDERFQDRWTKENEHSIGEALAS